MWPRDNNKKVSAAVRILHQKRDASARATHLKATDGIVSSVTIERKQMSTKTSFKRIALVAASALALGGFSVISAPQANAALSISTVTGISLVRDTGTAVVGTAVGVNFGFKAAADTAVANERETFTAYVSSYPANGYAAVTSTVTDYPRSTAADFTTPTNTTTGGAGTASLWFNATAAAAISTTTYAATSTAAHGQFAFTPTKAGTYELTVFNDYDADGAVDPSEFRQTISITVAAAAGLSTSASTVFMAAAGASTYDSTTNAVARSAAKAAGTDIASIKVSLVNSDGTAHSAGSTVSATISGAGFIASSTSNSHSVSTLRTTSVAADSSGLAYIHIDADGTSGTGTVTVSVTDVATLATTVLGTFTVTSYGAVTKLAVSTTNYTIGKAGTTTGKAAAARTAGGETLTATDTDATVPAFIVKATDSAGALVNLTGYGTTAAEVPSVVSSDATVVTGGTCVLDNGSSSTYSSGSGVGYYNCSFTSATAAKSGGKATLTIRTIDPAGDGTTYLTTTLAVTVGGATTKEVISTDKASYSVGEGMIVTITATDASGNPVYDGAPSPALSGNKAVGGSLPAAGQYVGGKLATDAGDVFAPAVGGDFMIKGTGTDAAETALSATVSIEGDASSALALDAANAATDAANNAYDEAQNATQAASDALAAVTALAKQVKSLIASVKKLTAAVAKLKK